MKHLCYMTFYITGERVEHATVGNTWHYLIKYNFIIAKPRELKLCGQISAKSSSLLFAEVLALFKKIQFYNI